MTRRTDDEWRVPALDRMREDIARVAAADATTLRPVRPPRRRLLVAVAAVMLAALVVATMLDGGERDAVAGVREAPRAAAGEGSFAFRTTFRASTSQGSASSAQVGSVDLRRSVFAARTVVAGRRGAERVAVGGVVFFRAPGARGGAWRRAGGARLPAFARPVSASGLAALADARGERLISRREEVDGVPVEHFRLRMPATTFLRLQGAETRASLRGVRGVVDVWLGRDDDLPRRVRASFTARGSGRSFSVDTRYSGYGDRVAAVAPAAARPVAGGNALSAADPGVTSMLALFAG